MKILPAELKRFPAIGRIKAVMGPGIKYIWLRIKEIMDYSRFIS
jgi:hypothetical protein